MKKEQNFSSAYVVNEFLNLSQNSEDTWNKADYSL